MKNKLLTVFLCLALLTGVLSSCATKDKFLKECGEDVISMMVEMLENDEYKEIYGVSDQYDETISKLREGNYEKRAEIYELTVPIDQLLEKSFDEDDFSKDVYTYLCSSAYTSFVSRINIASGVDSVATSSMFTAQKCFTNNKVEENTIYLYVFEDAYPIAVTFTVSGDNTLRALGNFILNDEFDTDDEDSIKKSCKDLGISGVKVNKQ